MALIDRLKIGVPDLDKMLLGGIPKGSLCLVLGPPGSGKSIFSKRFLYSGIQEGKEGLLVSTNESDERARETMKLFKWGEGTEKNLLVLDCYSWKSGKSSSPYSASLKSLTDISISLTSMITGHSGGQRSETRLVFDSFTDVINYSGSDRALRFLDSLRTKVEASRVTGLLLLEEGVHDERTIASVEYATDGTIRMRFSEQGRFLMVSRMTATPLNARWMPFLIGG